MGTTRWYAALPMAVGRRVALGGMVAVAQLPPGRDLLLRLRPQGQGHRLSNGRTRGSRCASGRLRVIRSSRPRSPAAIPAMTRPRPCWRSRLCASRFDDLPNLAGQLTTAQAMGATLQRRLQAHGMTFRVVGDE